MPDKIVSAKKEATRVQTRLSELGVKISHTQALEAVAAARGFSDWNRHLANLQQARQADEIALIEISDQPLIDLLPSAITQSESYFSKARLSLRIASESRGLFTSSSAPLALYQQQSDSMHPTIQPNKILVVEMMADQQDLNINDEVCLIQVNGALHVVRVLKTEKGLLLKRDNPRWPSHLMTPDEIHSGKTGLRILAKWRGVALG